MKNTSTPKYNIVKQTLFALTFSFYSHACFAQNTQEPVPHHSKSPELESRVVDTIANLKEVKERTLYINKKGHGKNKLKITIWQKPTKAEPYYWVKVMEDNGSSLYTHFNFYVYPPSLVIKYYDEEKDEVVDLTKWRKANKN
ncbi:MAG: hypothetical protein ACJ75B_07650 [Flavisolibacter sp.]